MNHQLLAETFIFVIVNLNGNLKRLNGNDSMNVVLKQVHRVMICRGFKHYIIRHETYEHINHFNYKRNTR